MLDLGDIGDCFVFGHGEGMVDNFVFCGGVCRDFQVVFSSEEVLAGKEGRGHRDLDFAGFAGGVFDLHFLDLRGSDDGGESEFLNLLLRLGDTLSEESDVERVRAFDIASDFVKSDV